MPISAVSAIPGFPAASAPEGVSRPAAPESGPDLVSVSPQAKILAAPGVSFDTGSLGNIGNAHEFDAERVQRLLKLLE